MSHQRWLRIIPVALIMYTISYVDRTNVSLALDPKISSLMRDLAMNDELKGQAAGIFFLGYILLQAAGGHLASRWSAKKLVSLCLVFWGAFAVGCGLSKSFRQFEVMRFLLGVSESCVFPATLVLLANWFPRAERARATAYWNLCQPLAVAGSAPISGWLLGAYGWQTMLILEGILPFVWLPIWWFFISDHPCEAKWISPQEREFLETTLQRESQELEPPRKISIVQFFLCWQIPLMIVINFLHNSQAYGCMTFLTDTLKAKDFSAVQYGFLFAGPYVVTAIVMVLNSWHSDKTRERRGHVAFVYILSGSSLIASVLTRDNFWLSYAFMCLAIPGPFAALAPFWAIPTETMPGNVFGPVIGFVNAMGSLGGFAGPYIVGALTKQYYSTAIPFNLLGAGLLVAAALAFLLPKHKIQMAQSASSA